MRLCQFQVTSKDELHHHVNSTHYQTVPLSCDICKYTTKSSSDLEKHIKQVHTQRTRIFSSSRISTPTPSARKPQQTQQQEVFRPWSTPSCSSSSSVPMPASRTTARLPSTSTTKNNVFLNPNLS